jgi:hypothetical protein
MLSRGRAGPAPGSLAKPGLLRPAPARRGLRVYARGDDRRKGQGKGQYDGANRRRGRPAWCEGRGAGGAGG